MTQRIGLIGKPVAHSVSPAFQQAALDYYGLDARYEAWETEPEGLAATVAALPGRGYLGANVTVPYKEAVIPLMDHLDDVAATVGAVNTVVNRDGQLWGYNTDGEGFLRALRQQAGYDVRGQRVLVLGAGGAARAVVMALLRARAAAVSVANRTWERAQRLVQDLRAHAGTAELQAVPYTPVALAEATAGCGLLVNCTSIGMRHTPEEGAPPLSPELIPPGVLVFDVVANPLETRLLAEARRRGARTVNGLTMLVYQGAAAFELWTGLPAPVDVMLAAAQRAMDPEGGQGGDG
ncbi:MAG: shikimate dehydrogenase [Dehalococcoidia bacterium]